MLMNTFQHIPGIGSKTEEKIWHSGAREWGYFKDYGNVKLPKRKLEILTKHLQESIQHYDSNNPCYFADMLPANLHWRFFPEFRNQTVYLDIETDGLDSYIGEITTIALYDGNSIAYYVNGRNIDDFISDIEKYKVIVTYNGKCFDIPFIQEYFDIEIGHAHIDLRYVLSSMGLRGGLKNCELSMGINRGTLKGIDGFFAPLLWSEYKENGNEKALETLLAYNIEDAINLETLMVMAYNSKIENTPFRETHGITLPKIPKLPFQVDDKIVQKINNEMSYEEFYEY